MSKKDKNKRTYDSSRRQKQAQETRQAITEAARKLFIEQGYAGATISAIAKEAEVSAESIYATFGNKRAILAHLVEVSVVGDDKPISLLERSFVKETEAETNQHQQIRMFTAQIYGIMERMAPIFDVMRTAAKTEAEIATMRERILQKRKEGMAHFVRAVATNGSLREDLNIEKAAEIVFALSSGEMFNVLISDLGWSSEQYTTWLTESIISAILPV